MNDPDKSTFLAVG